MKRLIPFFLLSLFALVACNDDDDKSIALDNSVVQFVENRYSGAKIRHAEYSDDGLIEVEILHDSLVKDVYFSYGNEWVYTSWDVRLQDLPAVVKDAVAVAYPDFIIDDADFVETASRNYYEIEIDKGKVEMIIFVSPDGSIIER